MTPKIIKTDTCKSSSGQSTLTYHIGKDEADTYLRIDDNTGGGLFSKEWIPLSAIQEAIDKSKKPFTSGILQPLFKGKSINTPSFMLAVLLCEGLVKREKRRYVKGDTKRKPKSVPKTAP